MLMRGVFLNANEINVFLMNQMSARIMKPQMQPSSILLPQILIWPIESDFFQSEIKTPACVTHDDRP